MNRNRQKIEEQRLADRRSLNSDRIGFFPTHFAGFSLRLRAFAVQGWQEKK
jgi:hypothetical protein